MIDLQGTYLQWLDFNCFNLEHEELQKTLTQDAQIFVNDGSTFGEEGNNYIRFNLSCPTKELASSLERLTPALKKYYS